MTILYAGIDLAKNIFALHGVNEAGKAELIRPAVPREKLHALVASLPPCVIGMEACSGAHHWTRLFQSSGHTVRLIAPKFHHADWLTGSSKYCILKRISFREGGQETLLSRLRKAHKNGGATVPASNLKDCTLQLRPNLGASPEVRVAFDVRGGKYGRAVANWHRTEHSPDKLAFIAFKQATKLDASDPLVLR